MPKGADKVEFAASQTLSWARFCVLCLNPATKENSVMIGGGHIPYCDACHAKVQRLRRCADEPRVQYSAPPTAHR